MNELIIAIGELCIGVFIIGFFLGRLSMRWGWK